MKRILILFLGFTVFFSCEENEDSGSSNPNSVAIGTKIYSIEEGADQEGFLGQYLQEEIKISVTDFEGKPLYADFNFELSDEGGRVSSLYNYDEEEEDWMIFRWKLGCTDDEQTLTIKDNVCNISKDGCVDVVIFEITVNASEPTTGWIESCYEYDFGYSSVEKMFAHEGELFVYTYSDLFVTSDVSTNSWNEINSPTYLNEYNDVWHFEGGEMIFENGSSLYVSENNGRSWSNMSLPSYGDGRVTILANGKYLYISEYSNSVYESSDKGNNWNVLISDIATVTGNYNTEVLAITSSGNTGYVITNNQYIIEINGSTNNIHEYSNAWNSYSYLEEVYAMVQEDQVIIVSNDYSYYNASVVSLSSNSLTSSISLSSPTYLTKESGRIFLLPKNEEAYYYEYESGSFKYKLVDISTDGNSYNYGHLTIFKGKPVFYSGSSHKFYYYKD